MFLSVFSVCVRGEILVLIMQGGFLLLESGVTRSKNSINVAMKNIADFIVSIVIFWAISFGLIFGSYLNGFIGSDLFFYDIGQGEFQIAIS